jgi:hypothetical protein
LPESYAGLQKKELVMKKQLVFTLLLVNSGVVLIQSREISPGDQAPAIRVATVHKTPFDEFIAFEQMESDQATVWAEFKQSIADKETDLKKKRKSDLFNLKIQIITALETKTAQEVMITYLHKAVALYEQYLTALQQLHDEFDAGWKALMEHTKKELDNFKASTHIR